MHKWVDVGMLMVILIAYSEASEYRIDIWYMNSRVHSRKSSTVLKSDFILMEQDSAFVIFRKKVQNIIATKIITIRHTYSCSKSKKISREVQCRCD